MRSKTKNIALGGGAILAAVAGTFTATAYAVTEPQTVHRSTIKPVTNSEIAGLFDTWNRALATGDATKVAALYAPDAILLPTLSDENRTDREQITEYFAEDFLPRNPQGVITESKITILDRNTATHSGDYDFTVTGADGSPEIVPARFTFVYEKTNGQWLISTHHSSVEPAAK